MVVWGEFGVWLCGESLGSGSVGSDLGGGECGVWLCGESLGCGCVGRVWGVVVWGEFGEW